MSKITPEQIVELKALFNDNNKATSANFSQLIDFFNENKVTDNGDGTFSVNGVIVKASDLATTDNIENILIDKKYATQQQLATKADNTVVAPLVYGMLHDGADLDNEKSAGTFFSINKVTNGPGFPNGDMFITWVVSAMSSTEATTFTQMAFTQEGDMAIRNFVSGADWGSWKLIATTSDVTTAIGTATSNLVTNNHPNTPWMTIADTPSDYLGYRIYNQSLFITGRLTVGSSTTNKLGSIPSSIFSQIDFPYSAITDEHYGFTVGYLHSNMALAQQATYISLASVAILLQPNGDIVIDPLMTSNISDLEVAGTYRQDVYAVLPLK